MPRVALCPIAFNENSDGSLCHCKSLRVGRFLTMYRDNLAAVVNDEQRAVKDFEAVRGGRV